MLPTHRAIILADPDADKLIIYHDPTGAATFDPSLTTSVSTTVIWQTEAGTTVTTGTSHALSYTPTAGPKVCKITVLAGLRSVTGIDCNSDLITTVKNLRKCPITSPCYLYINASLTVDLADIPLATNIALIGTNVRGSLSSISRSATKIEVPASIVTGSLADLPVTVSVSVQLQSCTGITPASIAHLVAIRDLRIYSMGWNATGVDTVLLSASDAVWADANRYTYASPSMRIGGTNATPGGSSGADTTDPLVTPGSGNSNADWQWDAGKSAHKALTGKAAVYYLTHLATHTWAITYAT